MRLLIDMNLSPQWVRFLEQAQFEAVHWSSIGPVNAADTALMAYAHSKGFAILTHDLDFGAILAATQGTGPSVVQIRADDLSTLAIGRQVVAALHQSADALAARALLTVDPGSRITLLPLETNLKRPKI